MPACFEPSLDPKWLRRTKAFVCKTFSETSAKTLLTLSLLTSPHLTFAYLTRVHARLSRARCLAAEAMSIVSADGNEQATKKLIARLFLAC